MEYICVCLDVNKKFLGFGDDCGRSLSIGNEIFGNILISKQDLLDLDMITEEIDALVSNRTFDYVEEIEELKERIQKLEKANKSWRIKK